MMSQWEGLTVKNENKKTPKKTKIIINISQTGSLTEDVLCKASSAGGDGDSSTGGGAGSV